MNLRYFVRFFSLLVASSPALAGVSGVYDANNVLIGEYVESHTVIHSVKGFRFALDGSTATIQAAPTDISDATYDTLLSFSTADCQGQAYITIGGSNLAGGMIFNGGSRGLYYVAKTPATSIIAMGSTFNGSNCSAISPALYQVVPASPNDPATTGVPNTPFMAPIHLEMVPLSQFFELFKNGFESSFADQNHRLSWGQTSRFVRWA